jgi:hypothetical protein
MKVSAISDHHHGMKSDQLQSVTKSSQNELNFNWFLYKSCANLRDACNLLRNSTLALALTKLLTACFIWH